MSNFINTSSSSSSSLDYSYLDEITILTLANYNKLSVSQQASLTNAIDRLGIASGISQDLKGPITSIEKLIAASSSSSMLLSKDDMSHVVILYKTDHPCGFLKFGRKNLYFYNKSGQCNQYNCVCLLDFYVEENCQRMGIGKKLFEEMLTILSLVPSELAYDRPSPKLIAFLSKNYNLKNHDLQPNRYALYNDFFTLVK